MVTPVRKEDRAVAVVREYVSEKKGWPDTDYTIDFKMQQGDTLVYWVIHRDDESGRTDEAGGGKSIEVHVSAESLEVQRELHFQ